MIFPLFMMGLGAMLANRGKPKTKVETIAAFGPKTGLTYRIEKIEDAQVWVIRLPSACMAVRRKDKKWWAMRGAGDPRALKAIETDFDVQFEPKPEPEALSI